MKIAIIGRGNVATHLERALRSHADVTTVDPHTLDGMPEDAVVSLISVTDNAIADVAKALHATGFNGIVAHTSGSTPMEALGMFEHRGVFYPLQTFSRDVELDYGSIPFFIEGDSEATAETLSEIAALVSPTVHRADSSARKQLHIASVMACNFTNHLYTLADSLLREKGYDISVLLPLIGETVGKLRKTTPAKAQTGPAARRDTKTINAHLEALADYGRLKEIYGLMTDSIIAISDNTQNDKETHDRQ